MTLRAGRITSIDSEALGIAALVLGAGRRTKEDSIDPSAGLVIDAFLGEVVQNDAPPQIILQHSMPPEDGRVAEARAMIEAAFVISPVDSPAPPVRTSRILEVIR